MSTESTSDVPRPVFRRLRGYSFDPSLSVQMDTVGINESVFKIDWEEELGPGPVGEYLEVVDYDPASGCFYEPVNLNHPYVLAQDGLDPSESNPAFHQQMVYAAAMTTIQHFERALGRRALWSSTLNEDEHCYIQRLRIYPHALRQANAYYSPVKKALLFGYFPASGNAPGDQMPDAVTFTCLSHEIIAHETTHALLDGMNRRFIEDSHPDTLAFHEAFADIVALFQHFTFPEVLRQQIAKTRGDLASQNLLGELAQQFGRAIGQYGALRDAIGQFDKKGIWTPHKPDPNEYKSVEEPHARGAVLVAAVFEVFISIYKCRVGDLLRIATNGSGLLTPGELGPDLVNRLAVEASKAAQHVLNMCIRALDYCPPVDITFGDYLRAIITADLEVVPNDERHYRIAFIEAFRRRGIYPRGIRTLSEDSVSWDKVQADKQPRILREIALKLRFFVHFLTYVNEFPDLDQFPHAAGFVEELKELMIPNRQKRYKELRESLGAGLGCPDCPEGREEPQTDSECSHALWVRMSDRERLFGITRAARCALEHWMNECLRDPSKPEVHDLCDLTRLRLGSVFGNKAGLNGKGHDDNQGVKVNFFRGANRVTPDGRTIDRVVIALNQEEIVRLDDRVNTEQGDRPDAGEKADDGETFTFRGGCTLILDMQTLSLKYVVAKPIDDQDRLKQQRDYRGRAGASLRATYFGRPSRDKCSEPFFLLHSEL